LDRFVCLSLLLLLRGRFNNGFFTSSRTDFFLVDGSIGEVADCIVVKAPVTSLATPDERQSP
jgi:hypothetical protein